MITKEKRPIKGIMQEPIDYIDLTEESPVNRALRIRNVNYENISNSCTRKNCKKANRKQPVESENVIVIDAKDTISKDNRKNANDKSIVEIIDLDDTAIQDKAAACFADDAAQGNLVMLTCPICFEQLSSRMKPMSTRCGHIFCAQCLQRAIKGTHKCPTCKATVRLKACTRLYF